MGLLRGFDNKESTPYSQFFTHKGENGTVQRGMEEVNLDLQNEMEWEPMWDKSSHIPLHALWMVELLSSIGPTVCPSWDTA